MKYYLDEDTVSPAAILPANKWENSHWSDIEVEKGMTKATKEANGKLKSTDGDSKFLCSILCRPIPPFSDSALKFKLTQIYTESGGQRRTPRAYTKCLPQDPSILMLAQRRQTSKNRGNRWSRNSIVTFQNSAPNMNDKPYWRCVLIAAGPGQAENWWRKKIQRF